MEFHSSAPIRLQTRPVVIIAENVQFPEYRKECSDPLNLNLVFSQPRFSPAPVWKVLFNLDPEACGMIWVQPVGKFMDHDILSDARRQKNYSIQYEVATNVRQVSIWLSTWRIYSRGCGPPPQAASRREPDPQAR